MMCLVNGKNQCIKERVARLPRIGQPAIITETWNENLHILLNIALKLWHIVIFPTNQQNQRRDELWHKKEDVESSQKINKMLWVRNQHAHIKNKKIKTGGYLLTHHFMNSEICHVQLNDLGINEKTICLICLVNLAIVNDNLILHKKKKKLAYYKILHQNKFAFVRCGRTGF